MCRPAAGPGRRCLRGSPTATAFGRSHFSLVTLLLLDLPHLVKKVIFVALQACTPQPTERAPAAPRQPTGSHDNLDA
jgi:hypothetical protein